MLDARRAATVIAAVAAAVFPLVLAQAAAPGTWGTAKEVPGTAALNRGGIAQVVSVSCGSAGNCAAGGWYTDRSGHHQAFVASEVKGTWHAAIEVRGLAALNRGESADVNSVSCPSAGNCAAGGYYTDRSGHGQAFVASQVDGTWHAAIKVPGTAALKRGFATVVSVSCGSAGNCAASGVYVDHSRHGQVFVASEVQGTWHAAIEMPGIAALNRGGDASVESVSCRPAGNCAAGGWYTDRSGRRQAFVASKVNGTWHPAIEVPGVAAREGSGHAEVSSVSCGSAGNCAAAGSYNTNPDNFDYHAFLASEVNGTWRKAFEVPGIAALDGGNSALASSVSCGSAGNCAVGGLFGSLSTTQVFVASKVNGTWHAAIEVPGTAALNQGGDATVQSVSCGPAGNCAVGGDYTDGSAHFQAFVASAVNGTWQPAIEVPGIAALDQGGYATVQPVSCGPGGNCAAGGIYTDHSGHQQAFVVDQPPPRS